MSSVHLSLHLPLGSLDVQCWVCDPKQTGKKHQRHQLPIEAKQCIKWPNSDRAVAGAQKLCGETMLVSVVDREANLYEPFHDPAQDTTNPKLLVHAERIRQWKLEQQPLWSKISTEPLAGVIEVAVPRKGPSPARNATIEVRFAQVLLTRRRQQIWTGKCPGGPRQGGSP